MIRAIILAAGEGTRLRPLTDNKPKCLAPLLGVSLLQRQLDTLRKAGIEDIHLVTGYQADRLSEFDLSSSFNEHYASTNMVASLFCASDFMQPEEDLLICYGDIVYQPDNLQAMLNCAAETSLMIDILWHDLWSLRLENPLEDAETLVMDSEGKILELGKKTEDYSRIQGQYTGLIKIRGDKVEAFRQFYQGLDRSAFYDGKDFDNMYMTSLLQAMIDANWPVTAVPVNNGWLEIDTLQDLQQYEALAASGELSRFYKSDY